MLTTILDAAAGWPVPLVLAAAALLLMVESGTLFGMVLPGTTVLVALGLWTHVAPGALVPTVVVAATATVTGAHFGWWRARTGSGRLRSGPVSARKWLSGRGPVATAGLIAGGHWASAARPIMPRVAGGAGVPYRVAGPVLAVSGAAWATTLVLLSNAVGPAVLDHAGWLPIVVLATVIGALLVRSRRTAGFPTTTAAVLNVA
ncbi:hypothetical protein [Pseudonocardia sp. GCM10023141]|uniref:hypothetical protein n=1 Tax=Pseudonocardia sp. GCM10023141 TaxID=3252653 RepID=UPI0036106092